MKNMAKKNEVADFLSEIESEREESKGNVRFPTRDTLQTERDGPLQGLPSRRFLRWNRGQLRHEHRRPHHRAC